MTDKKKCLVFVSVTLYEYSYAKGPTKNTVYPAEWMVSSLPLNISEPIVDSDIVDYLVSRAVSFVKAHTNQNLIEWKMRLPPQIGGSVYEAQISATCKNPFKTDDVWYVNAWLKMAEDEEEVKKLPCGYL